MRVCFITVGTTKFDQLIETLDNNCTEFLKLLHRKGIEKIIIQLGKGVHMPRKLVEAGKSCDIYVEWFTFTEKIRELIEEAYIVISHAGAGSIVETLRAEKPLFVVVNEELMDNHQVELANALGKGNFLSWATPSQFLSAFRLFDEFSLKTYPGVDMYAFPRLLNQEMDKDV